jgi:hypothetical protein
VNDDGTLTDTTPFVVDASGSVGIGTATPGNIFDVVSGNSQFQFAANADEPALQIFRNSSSLDNKKWRIYATSLNELKIQAVNDAYSASATAIGITRNGNSISKVLLGGLVTTGDSFAKAAGAGDLTLDNGTTDTPGIFFYRGANNNFGIDSESNKLRFVVNLNEVGGNALMVLDDAGKLGIGTAGPELKLDVQDDIEVGTGTTGCVRDEDNTTIAGTCSSDIRLKKNIVPLPDVLSKLSQLTPVTFDWIDDTNKTPNYGLIAQETEKILPELVQTGEDGFKRITYDTSITMMLLQGVKELDAKIGDFGVWQIDASGNTVKSDIFSTEATLDGLSMVGALEEGFTLDTTDYLRARVKAGVRFTRTLISERVVAAIGWFNKVSSKEVCLRDGTGETCINKTQLDQLLSNTQSSNSTNTSSTTTTSTSSSTTTTTPTTTTETTPTTTTPTDPGPDTAPTTTATTTTTTPDPILVAPSTTATITSTSAPTTTTPTDPAPDTAPTTTATTTAPDPILVAPSTTATTTPSDTTTTTP